MPPPRSGSSSNGIVMPVSPAPPRNRAYSDHNSAARVPTLISVSIVAAPCLRFCHAALWNGQPAHSTTGAASCSDSHCQLSNCSAGIIDIRKTGSASTAANSVRRRSSTSGSDSASASGGAALGSLAW